MQPATGNSGGSEDEQETNDKGRMTQSMVGPAGKIV